jgi:hypothetical protein
MGRKPRMLHFVRTHPVFGEVRVVTNGATQGEQDAHEVSSDSNNVAELSSGGNLFAVKSGDWLFHMLMKRAEAKNLNFRLNVVENGCINPVPWATDAEKKRFHQKWKKALAKATFAWANAGSSFFLQIDGAKDWGLKPLGLEVIDAPKTAKRNNEVSRASEMAHYTEDPSSIRPKVRTPKGVSSAGRDGMNYISKRLALLMVASIGDPARVHELSRDIENGRIQLLGTGRLVFPSGWLRSAPKGGMIKGHFIVRDDKFMGGYDIITVPENIKDEIRATDNFIMVTAEVKHPVYQATWDVQRMVMNPQVLTHEHRARDLTRLVDTIKESIEEGVLPEWLLLDSSEMHEEDLGSIRDEFSDLDSVPIRWQAAGLDIRAAQNVVRMAMGAVVGRMSRFFDEGCFQGDAKGYARRMWLPKSNAFVAYFISHGSLTKVGNFQTRRDGKKAYMVRGIGLVLPDNRIEDMLSLMGGADFDDSAEVNLIKVWSSSEDATSKMREAGVIGKNDPIATSADDASYMACLLRSPNGIGEYVMVQMENILKAPWQFLDLDNVEVVDLATLPTPATLLATKGVLKSTIAYSKASFTADDAYRQIMAQQFNPGIGQAANALMAWIGSGGVDLPPSLNVGFEQLVDGVQQLSDPVIFRAVKDIGSNISYDALCLLEAGNEVDQYLVPRFAGREDRAVASAYAVFGPYSEFQEEYRKAIKDIYDTVQQKSLQMRNRVPVVNRVRDLGGPSPRDWANKFTSKYEGKLASVESKFAYVRKLDPGIKKVSLIKAKHAEMRAVVDEAVAELEQRDQAPKQAVVLWHSVLCPRKDRPYGVFDRLIFQPGNGRSIMDLVIEGLNEYELIRDDETPSIPEPEAWGDEEDGDDEFFAALLDLMEDDSE